MLNPGALAKLISTRIRVQLVDLPEMRREQSLFSAPQKRLSVVDGREVIANYLQLMRSVISELSLKFIFHCTSQHHDSLTLTAVHV